MQVKTINKLINSKFKKFVASIEDEKVRNLVRKNSIITGGAIASGLLNEPINDFDVYFTNKETTKAVAEYFVKQFNKLNSTEYYVIDGATFNPTEADYVGGPTLNLTEDRIKVIVPSDGVAREEGTVPEGEEEVGDFLERPEEEDESSDKPQFRPIFISPNAITLSNKIQIVLRFYGSIDEIHLHYDYAHCTNYWLSSDEKIYLKEAALKALLEKQLIYVGSLYPIASLIRTRKFIKRGYHINAGQYLKMAMQISKLDLTDPVVLEDQLVGVDVTYFTMLINAIKSQDKERVDDEYVTTIIDKIFN